MAISWPPAPEYPSSPAGKPLSDGKTPPSLPAPPNSGERAAEGSIKHSQSPFTVRLQPALALAILGAEQAPAGRIWLLCRYLDEAGRGWLATDQVRDQLTREESLSRVCGRRQLRNLLNQGQGIFWERRPAQAGRRERIWLRSPARVAESLGLERLAGRPVDIPLAALLGSIGRVRAHFYASFHDGRQDGDAPGAPISRSTLARLTHVPPRTQRLYDQAAGVQRTANYAVGAEYSCENIQERAWQHGRAAFRFVDHQGRQGHAGRRYVAWRLPNSYAIIAYSASGSTDKRKRNNKRPVDLVTIGAQGNDRALQGCPPQPKSLFHAHGSAAGKAYNRDSGIDAYWPESVQPSRAGSRLVKMWQVIGHSASRRGGNLLPGL